MTEMPDTGGISPALISSIAVLALAVGATGLYALRRRTA
ncbi:MAG: LPXTG cell wall anchor domain-containing protein [Rubrobacteraceae bacterium]